MMEHFRRTLRISGMRFYTHIFNGCLCAFALCMLTSSANLYAQVQAEGKSAKPPEFEVATIKPTNPSEVGGRMGFNRDEFMTNGQTLKALIKFAYDLNFGSDQQVIGGPDWIGSARFDISAKEDPDSSAMLQKLPPNQMKDAMRLMLQALLADRFKLAVHHENRILPLYTLVLAKGGMKMAVPESPATPNTANTWHGIQVQGKGRMEGRGANLQMITNVISMQSEIGGRMVIDKTGLTGTYDFLLRWTPETLKGGSGQSSETGALTNDLGPSLFTALQDDLGLKIESAKAPVDVIVIDRVEMPSEN